MQESDLHAECGQFLAFAALEMTARGLTRAKFVRAAGQFGDDTQDWKQRLFGSDGPLARLVRSCVPLRCTGSHWAFMHKTVQEFSLANAVYEIAMRNEVPSGGAATGWEGLSLSRYDGQGEAVLPGLILV